MAESNQHKIRFIILPVLAIAAHYLMTNVLYMVVGVLFLDVLKIQPEQFMKFSYLAEMLIYIIMILIFFAVSKLTLKRDENEIITELNLKDSAMSMAAGLGVAGFSFLWATLADKIPALQKSVEAMNAGAEAMGGGTFIGAFLVAAIGAPLIEEILFRGIVFRSLRKISPAWVSILISAVLFGAYHLNIVQVVYTTLMGIVTGIIYEKKKNLIFPIMAHFANNFLAAVEGSVPDTGKFIINVFSVAMIIPACFIIYRMLKSGGYSSERSIA